MTTKTQTPRPVLPEGLSVPEPMADAKRLLEAARDEDFEAAAAVREAKLAHDAAPAADDASAVKALEAGKEPPVPTAPKRKAELEAAQRRARAARELLRRRAAEFRRVFNQHREEVAAEQAPDLDAATAEAIEALDVAEAKFEALSRQVAFMSGLHRQLSGEPSPAADRMALLGRPAIPALPRFDSPPPPKQFAELRAEAERRRITAVPLPNRIALAIGDGVTSWEDVAEKLGVSPIDMEVCRMRDILLTDGTLQWCDADGDPIPSSGVGGVVVRKRYLRRGTLRPTAKQRGRAKLEAQRRKAAA